MNYPTERTIKGLQRLKRDKNELVLNLIKAREGIIVASNIDQLEEGKRSDQSRITPGYANITKIIKANKIPPQPTSRVTLRDEGDFQESIYIEYGNDFFKLSASDPKTLALLDKYGEKILGITTENLKDIQPSFIKDLKSYITLNVL